MRVYATFKAAVVDSGVTGFRSATWAPGTEQSLEQTAMTVGLRFEGKLQTSCRTSNEASPSQSITMRSWLPLANRWEAFAGLRQKSVLIEKSRKILSIVQDTVRSCEISKHSNAISGVMSAIAPLGYFSRCQQERRNCCAGPVLISQSRPQHPLL